MELISLKTMEELDYSAISFTNPSAEDFTWEWGGKPYTIKAGEVKFYPEFLAKHLAKHLAYKMASGRMDQARELEKTIIGTVEIDQPAPLTKGEELATKIAEVEKVAEEEAFAELKPKAKVVKKAKASK